MSEGKRFLRGSCMALIAALMAGCSAGLVSQALGLTVPWLWVYSLSFIGAGMVQLIHRGGGWALGFGAALAVSTGAMLALCVPRLIELLQLMGENADAEALEAARAATGTDMACLCAFLFGALLAELMRSRSGVPFALLVLLSALIFALATNEEISLWLALPGLAAGVAAFGLPRDARRDGVPPGLLIPALLLSVLALILTPSERVTWEPLEELAQRVRSITEDYVRFTEERMAFSINEKGFDHAGMAGDELVSMLGGPAHPSQDEVMRVQTDTDLLLRGTIMRTYTGYSWVDDQPKARYLYYDITHGRTRAATFDEDTNVGNSAFSTQSAEVEMLERGTSTLFAPAQLATFDMGLEDALYYNSAGELFLTRDVRPGDHYAFTARVPQSEEALILASQTRAGDADAGVEAARADYGALPAGIDARVYSLASQLTQNAGSDAEKAFAIQHYLSRNYRYTLEGNYPPEGEDFVSWFLIEEQAGYCSYFASAMTVMCRMVGLPARYVEGYSVDAAPGGESIITGEDAHAWVEVYLSGLGWVAFDPTAAARDGQGGGNGDGSGNNTSGGDGSAGSQFEAGDSQRTASAQPSPAATPENGGVEPGSSPESAGGNSANGSADEGDLPDNPDGGADGDANTDTGDGDGKSDSGDGSQSGDGAPDASAAPTPPGNPPESNPPDSPDKDNHWLWWLILILLALICLSVALIRHRLRATDPMLLSANCADKDEAALILCRATLMLLGLQGCVPESGETLVAFATRVNDTLGVPDYLNFCDKLSRCRYAGVGADRQLIKDGRGAYRSLLRATPRFTRLRFHMQRMLHGLGDIEEIP